MLAAIEMIRERYGGAEGYLQTSCGLAKEDLEKIRRNIVDEAEDMTVGQT